jgi:hypothetical protein
VKTLDDFIAFCNKCITRRKVFLEAAMAENIRVIEYNVASSVDVTDDYIEMFQKEIATFEELISDLKDATS